jgi:hypothetical protein
MADPVDPAAPRECRVCRLVKPPDAMSKEHRTGKPRRICRECSGRTTMAHRRTDRGKELHRRAMRRACVAKFGLTVEQYEALLSAQGGACAICRNTCATGRMLAVDHDHTTGKVRALLCVACNRRLGTYESLREMAESYLSKYGEGNPLLADVSDAWTAPAQQRAGWKPATTKLTEGQVREIRERYGRGGVSQRVLAAEFGTSQINVSRIVRAETWRTESEME